MASEQQPSPTVGAAEAAAGQRPRRVIDVARELSMSPSDKLQRFQAPAAPAKPPQTTFFPADEGAGAGVGIQAPAAAVKPPIVGIQGPSTCGGSATEEEVRAANEVLRLRSLKTQHNEYKAQLAQAEAMLRRLSVFDILQLYSYLERHLGDSGLAMQVQEAVVRLIEGLCHVSGIEIASGADSLLCAARQLLREPHSFTSRLCVLPRMSSEEARGLAPFLLSTTQYRQIREREVNTCYEALHSWLLAYYFVSSSSDEMSSVTEELEHQLQECLVRRVSGKSARSPMHNTTSEASLHVPTKVPMNTATSEACLHATTKGGQLSERRGTSPSVRGAKKSSTPAGGSGGSSLAAAAAAATASTAAPRSRRGGAAPRSASPPSPPSGQNSSSSAARGMKAPKALAPIRMASDKTLTKLLRDKSARSPSPESVSASTSALPQLRAPKPPARDSLTSVPERRCSLPSKSVTLLESIHRRSSVPNLKEDPIRRRVSTPFPQSSEPRMCSSFRSPSSETRISPGFRNPAGL